MIVLKPFLRKIMMGVKNIDNTKELENIFSEDINGRTPNDTFEKKCRFVKSIYMAQGLELEIFSIAIRPYNSREKEFLNFQKLLDKIGQDKDKAYRQFITDFRNLFGGKFTSDSKKTKSITSPKEGNNKFSSQSNTIDCDILGGDIGSSQTIYNQDNADEPVGEITEEQIASLPFYLKLWTPYDHNSGILMVQSYTGHTVTALVKMKLKELFKKYGYTLIITPFIPEIVKKEYLKNSKVYELAIINNKISRGKRELLNPIFAEFDKLKIEIRITGFKKDVNNFWDIFKKKKNKLIGANLDDLDIDENNGCEIKAYYKDKQGHRANVNMRDLTKVSPTIFLPDEMKEENNHFNFEEIKKYTDGMLEQIKNEINYNR